MADVCMSLHFADPKCVEKSFGLDLLEVAIYDYEKAA